MDAKSPIAVPPTRVNEPVFTLMFPEYVPTYEDELNVRLPLPFLLSVAELTLPFSGPAQVKLLPCVSIVPPPVATVIPRREFVALIVAPICNEPPSNVTCSA